MAYALRIVREVVLPCDGVTTTGGFGNRAVPQLSQASGEGLRGVFPAGIPHYFRHVVDEGDASVAPRVENERGLGGADLCCVVSIIASPVSSGILAVF